MQQHIRDPCALEFAAAATDEIELAPCTGSRVIQSHAKRPRERIDVCTVLKPNVSSSSAHTSIMLICLLLAQFLEQNSICRRQHIAASQLLDERSLAS
eukprot:10749-Heterococcus_DN1.PRE.1